MNDYFEKAAKHQVGDTNSKGEVWVEYKPGKFDWRPAKHKAVLALQQNGGSGQQKPVAQPQASGNAGGQQYVNSKKNLSDYTPNELVDFANQASTSALEKIVNDKKQDKDIRQIAFNVLKKRDDYDKAKVDSSDLSGGHVAKPAATVQDKTKKPAIDIELPDTWTVRVPGKNGVFICYYHFSSFVN